MLNKKGKQRGTLFLHPLSLSKTPEMRHLKCWGTYSAQSAAYPHTKGLMLEAPSIKTSDKATATPLEVDLE